MLINARPHNALCRSHKHKCLSARGGGLIKDIYISSTGTCSSSSVQHFCQFVRGSDADTFVWVDPKMLR